MSSQSRQADVVVMGAGPIGLAVAWRLAQSAMAVTVVDPAPGRGAVWAAAGMLAPVTEVHPGEAKLLALNLDSAQRYPDFVAELEQASGLDTGYRTEGTLVVARDRDDLAAIDELAKLQESLGLQVERLGSQEIRALEPGLAPSVRGGLRVESDHQVDGRALVAALLEACRRSGVQIVNARVQQVRVEAGHARGVVLDSGEFIPAPTVVIAAGVWSGAIDGLPPGLLPVRPVKGQIVYLRGPVSPPLLSRNVRGVEVYLAPRRDGRLAVGATMEEQGFDTTATAGGVHELLRAARELVPGIDELQFDEVAVGLRPATADNGPLLGPTGVPGVFAATGHFRNGVLLTPATAAALDAWVRGALPSDAASAFGADRFATRTASGSGVA